MIDCLYPPFQHWAERGTVWIYSDPHFDDVDLEDGIQNRPTAEAQVAAINSKVGKCDTLIFLGDMGNVSWMDKVRKCRRILIMGNHDVGKENYEQYFDEIYKGQLIISDKLILSHEPVNIDWLFNIHGHVHNKYIKNDETHLNICSDAYGYNLLNLNQFIKCGGLSNVYTIHRRTIDGATKRKRKRV